MVPVGISDNLNLLFNFKGESFDIFTIEPFFNKTPVLLEPAIS
jgi:hypothetical protein